jgi:hypothetical protein
MRRFRIPAAFLTVLLAVLACNLPGTAAAPTAEPPTVNIPPLKITLAMASKIHPLLPTDTVAATAVPPLTEAMIRNGTYKAPQTGETVTLTDGHYDRATSNADVLHVALAAVALGDLNHDGAGDAAVIMSENTGGTGFFISLIVILNQNGSPAQGPDRFIEDRAVTNSLSIQDGRILLDIVLHGPGEPSCCPTFRATETYRLQAKKLVLTHFVSYTGSSTPQREIFLSSPAAGDSVSGSMTVVGMITILPFENTLAYAIFDKDDNKLTEGSFQATPGAGASGTFSAPIDLAGIPVGTKVRLEVSSVSPADGSILAMDSVEVLVK